MKLNRPAVKSAFPVGNEGLLPVPDYLDINSILERDEIYLYNPFQSGLSIKVESPQTLNYVKVSQGFIVDSPTHNETEDRSIDQQNKFRTLHQTSNTFWDVAVATFMRLAVTPKRDDGWKQDISPDMSLVISKPTRKPSTPKNTMKLKPKTSGR